MKWEIMLSSKSDLEFLLDRYRVSELVKQESEFLKRNFTAS